MSVEIDSRKSTASPKVINTMAGPLPAVVGRGEYGYNEIPEKKRNPLLKFLSYFWGPIPWMIEAGVILSAIVRHWAELAIIAVLLVVNAVIGFWEEYQAGNTIQALKAKLALRARVKRDGTWTNIAARELVPGDLIRVRLGDIIPADARLLEGDPIQIDQSALTGESLPVQASTGDTVYSGSVVKQGAYRIFSARHPGLLGARALRS